MCGPLPVHEEQHAALEKHKGGPGLHQEQ